MCSPDAVASHSLEDFQLTADRMSVYGSSKASQIVMHTYAIDVQRLVVQGKALFRTEEEMSETCPGLYPVKQFTVKSFELGNQGIQIRIIHTP